MSRIVDFYRGETLHPSGFGIDTVWGWNDRQLEVSHTCIQWLFPLREPSRAVPGSPTIAPAGDFETKGRRWLTPANHNHLRITRIPRSMVLLGLKREAVEWFAVLQRVYAANADLIGPTTYEYWHAAVEGRYRPCDGAGYARGRGALRGSRAARATPGAPSQCPRCRSNP